MANVFSFSYNVLYHTYLIFYRDLENAERHLKQAVIGFEMHKDHQNLISCYLELGKVYLIENELKEAKIFAQKAKEITETHTQTYFSGRCATLLDRINENIRRTSMNAFVFLKAYPLVHPDDYSHVGPITQSGSTFKNDITKILSSQNKALQIKFDILNRENLRAIKQYGCRVLHLASDQTDPNYLCAEGKNGILDMISFDSPYEEYFSEAEENNDLQELLFTSEERMNLDVVVLAFTESENLAKAITKNGVQHVIYFDFTDEFLDDYCTYDLSIDVTQELITAFCKAFYKHLIKRKSVIESMEHGKRVFTQRLKELEKLDLPKIDLYMIGEGPMLLPEDTYHTE